MLMMSDQRLSESFLLFVIRIMIITTRHHHLHDDHAIKDFGNTELLLMSITSAVGHDRCQTQINPNTHRCKLITLPYPPAIVADIW